MFRELYLNKTVIIFCIIWPQRLCGIAESTLTLILALAFISMAMGHSFDHSEPKDFHLKDEMKNYPTHPMWLF